VRDAVLREAAGTTSRPLALRSPNAKPMSIRVLVAGLISAKTVPVSGTIVWQDTP
jgi:hypothetical protein